MDKKKKPVPDQHKAKSMIRIPEEVYQRLKGLADRNDRPLSREAVRAILAHLEREGA